VEKYEDGEGAFALRCIDHRPDVTGRAGHLNLVDQNSFARGRIDLLPELAEPVAGGIKAKLDGMGHVECCQVVDESLDLRVNIHDVLRSSIDVPW
jgi:hypothetical protein